MPLKAVDLRDPEARVKIASADILLNFLLFTPLLVLHYQCTTVILDTLFLTWLPWLGAILLLALGVSGQFMLTFYQQRVPDLIPAVLRKDPMGLLVVTRLYTLLLVTINICHITAVTFIFTRISGGAWISVIKACTTATLGLWGLKAGRNTVCAPLYLSIDYDSDAKDFHQFSTVFRTKADESRESLLDCTLTTIVVYSFIHLHWASVTVIQDILFLPSIPFISMTLSLVLGFGACAVLIFLQHPASELSKEFEQENDVKRVAFEDLFQLAASVSVITYWRGVTMCFDLFMGIFPLYWRGFDVTALVGWIMSYLMLILVHLTNSLPFKGCDLDGGLSEGQGCLFSTAYFLDLLNHDKDTGNDVTSTEEPLKEKTITTDVATTPVESGVRQRRPLSTANDATAATHSDSNNLLSSASETSNTIEKPDESHLKQA